MRGRKKQTSGSKGDFTKIIKYKKPSRKASRKKPTPYKQPSIVSGKSLDDILNMPIEQFNKLSKRELQLVVGRMVSAVNKRIRRFEKSGTSTPATRALEKSGGKLSTKGKNINELRAEFARAKDFLQMETSSRAGFEKVQERTVNTLKERGVDVTPDELKDLFEVYNMLTELDPSITLNKDRYQLMDDIAKMDENTDTQTKVMQAKEKYNELYEQQQEEFGKEVTLYGVSGFFEI